MTRRQRIAALVATAFIAAVYVARLDRAAGLVVDDAWYVLLAQSLARGEGFRLISSAASAILPSVPPGFPAILAPIVRLHPSFPDNVVLLKAVSIAAMLATGALTFVFGARVRRWPFEIAAAIAVLTTVTPAFVFLATSTVMPESLFACAQLATVLAIERAADDEWRSGRRAAGAAVAAAVTWLIKASAAPLIAAGVVYFVFRRRLLSAAVFAVVALAGFVPWQLYATAHAPTTEERAAHGGSIAIAYGDSMRLRVAGAPRSGYATPADVVARVAANVFNVAARDANGLFVPALLRGPAESGEEVVALGGQVGLGAGSMGNARATEWIGVALSLVVCAGFVIALRRRAGVSELLVPLSLATTVLVPFHTFRYVLPLAPFLFGYVAEALHAIDPKWRLARIALLTFIVLDLTDHAQYIARVRAGQPEAVDWLADAHDVDETIAWLDRNLPAGVAVASSNPGLVYLETGRKGVAIDDMSTQRSAWRMLGIRYAVSLRPAPLPDGTGPYRVRYRTRRGLWVVELLSSQF